MSYTQRDIDRHTRKYGELMEKYNIRSSGKSGGDNKSEHTNSLSKKKDKKKKHH